MNEKINKIAIDAEQQQKVRKNSASSLPLNPTAQGWSAQKIREKLYRAICSDTGDLDDNLLDIIVDKLLSVKEVFEALKDGEFVVKKAEEDAEGNNIFDTYSTKQELASDYGSRITFGYDKSTRVLTLKLFAKDDTQLGDDLNITLPLANTTDDGLMSKNDKQNLNTLIDLLGVYGEDDNDNKVNKIREVLDVFENYPEADKLVDALAKKATKEELETAGFPNGWTKKLLTPSALTNGQGISKEILSEYDVINLFVIKTETGEIDTDSFETSIGLVDGYKYVFFDNADVYLSIANPNCTFTATSGYQLKIIGQKYVAQDAENVNYDKTVKNLLEAENVQDAIDELADEVLAPAFVEVEHLALQSEITATNNIEIKDDSGELVKITGNEPTNLVSNSELLIDSDSDGVPDGFSYANATDISLVNGIAKFTATATAGRLEYKLNDTDTKTIYVYARIKSEAHTTYLRTSDSNSHYAYHSGNSEYELLSDIYIASSTYNFIAIGSSASSGWTPIEVDYIGAINITDFIKKGVADDNGTLFSRLTNNEIKAQMDIWVQNGFPDHVINALYPDGADTAISLKYNDGDAI
ncbi:MAG TPA: hypothetical protein PK557_07750, partial [Paludibacteraceae bacterium]|nr:hypothetical protein [Paludibacteraceae bacterium]